MRTHRLVLGVPVICTLVSCHPWDWRQQSNASDMEDCKQHSVKESIAFYETFLPPRGFYQIFAIPEPADGKDEAKRPYSFVVFRVRDGRNPDQKDPIVERIIGPVRGKEEMTDLFSIFRKYASSPPIGYYCWQNDCRGKYSPAGDPDPRDPYPPEIPDHSGITTSVGYSVTPAPTGAVIHRETSPGVGTGGSGDGTGGAGCKFEPRGKTVLTAEVVENLRASASGVGKALDNVPSIPDAPQEYPPPYRQPPFRDLVPETPPSQQTPKTTTQPASK